MPTPLPVPSALRPEINRWPTNILLGRSQIVTVQIKKNILNFTNLKLGSSDSIFYNNNNERSTEEVFVLVVQHKA